MSTQEVCIFLKNYATCQHIVLFLYVCKQTFHISWVRISQKLNAINPESIRSCDSRTNPNSLQSKSKTSGLSSASRKKTTAELLFQQSQERFERKCKLLEKKEVFSIKKRKRKHY